MDRKRVLLLLLVLFALVYYIARIAIFLAVNSGTGGFEEEQSALVVDFVKVSFLVIGIVGLLMLPGLFLMKPWGFWGSVAVSAYTIAFDAWAFFTVQSSAAAGIIPAGIILGYLIFMRKNHLAPSSPTEDAPKN